MLNKKALAATAAADKLYVESVFSTYLYSGNSSTQSINNGIDLSTEGGMVWLKVRTAAANHFLFDTVRGTTKSINSNTTSAQATSVDSLTAFNTNGFSLGAAAIDVNDSGSTYASWTFRKAEKFFDVVTYTGNGTAGRTVSHNLGSVPGVIFVKNTSNGTRPWAVYHRSLGATQRLILNTTDAAAAQTSIWNDTAPTSTVFTVGDNLNTNGNGDTYVAYLFAHDAGGFGDSGSDNVISCGSFTTDGSGNATVSLGYEPQWALIKPSNSTGDWVLVDTMRSWVVAGNNDALLYANTSDAEVTGNNFGNPTATGFTVGGLTFSNTTYIYIAIRRGPMKTPNDATKVFQPVVYTGTNADNRLVDTTIAPDMVMVRQLNDTVLGGMVVGDRLRGNPYWLTGTSGAEVSDPDSFMTPTTGYGNAFSAMNGFGVGNDVTSKLNSNTTSNNHVAEAFKRAPGFFDVVCYTGTGSATTQAHNLGVVPEMMIVKRRNTVRNWAVYVAPVGTNKYLKLNLDFTPETDNAVWNNTAPTSTVFSLGTAAEGNGSGDTYVAYLFATVAGVSKVGSYTGNGSSQTINCGFTGGSRFVLIKRTDSTGDWVVFDSARGIVSGNDPYLELNTTDAEVTDKDAVDTDNTGFVINETTGPNINTNGASYIYLAIA